MDEVFSLNILYDDEHVPDDLYKLVRNGLCSQLESRLHELQNSFEYFTALTWHDQEQVSLLMVAALNGYDDIVRLLFTHCDPVHQIELKGRIRISEEECIYGATALYCACYRGHFTVAKTLIELGQANVNQDTYDDPRYPLLIHATIMNRLDIVRFLIENRYSHVNETKSDDGDKCTALIWAAYRGYIPLVEYFIENDADINYSCVGENLPHRTSLGLAIYAGHLESVRVLCNAGADTNIRSKSGDTLLMTATKNKHYTIINYLLEESIYTVEDFEFAACSLIDNASSLEQVNKGFELLRLTLQRRDLLHQPKVCIQPMDIYDYLQECQTIDELDRIKDDRPRIFIETLLIRERLFSSRKDIVLMKSLHLYGDMLVDNGEFVKCLKVWIYMFYIYQDMNMSTILHRFVWLFCKMLTANQVIAVEDFLQVCQLIFEPSQMEERRFTLCNALFLVVIAIKILEQEGITNEERTAVYRWINNLCRHQLTDTDGNTLLHLCVDNRTSETLSFRGSDIFRYLKFPNESGVRLLLTCGRRWLDLDAVESSYGNTALHKICQRIEDPTILKLLLNAGCHIDCVNKYGKTPLNYVKNQDIRSLFKSKSTPNYLKCLCARVIANKHLNTTIFGPSTSVLNKFIIMHGSLCTDDGSSASGTVCLSSFTNYYR